MSTALARSIRLFAVVIIASSCSPAPTTVPDAAVDAATDVPRVDSGPDCTLDCTGFDPSGACYCQTTCGGGGVQIFTCHSDGCVCQGFHANSDRVTIACTSREAAQQVYQSCFRW